MTIDRLYATIEGYTKTPALLPTARGTTNHHWRMISMSDAIRKCSVDGCSEKHHARDYCTKHYYRWKRNGDPLNPGKYALHSSPEDSFAARTEWKQGCLIWTASNVPSGYGIIYLPGQKSMYAHRYAWERANGPIPDGMQVDHICWNTSCVNLDHLRLASQSQNNANRKGPERRSKSGVRNVSRNGDGWTVRVNKHGKTHRFGTYSTIEEAAEVAERARQELFGLFAGRG